MDAEILFSVVTPLGITIRVTRGTWIVITTIKHPVMKGHEEEIKYVLTDPDEIRRSISDSDVYLFYKMIRERRWFCAVIKDQDNEGFLITAYPTDKIKEGDLVWKK